MSLPRTKSELMERLRTERDHWLSFLQGISPSQMEISGAVGVWSVKDVLAHILAYEQYLADRLREIVTGSPYRPSETPEALEAFQAKFGYPDFGSALLDDDGPNAWVVQKYRPVPLPALTQLEQQVFSEIQNLLAALSEDQFTQHDLYDRVASNTFEHYQEHTQDIHTWLATGLG